MSGTLDTVMQSLGLTLLHFLWQGLLLGLIFAVLMRVLRDSSAQARYLCSVATLAALFAMPFATYWWLSSQVAPSVPAATDSGALENISQAAAWVTTNGGGTSWSAWSVELLTIVVCAWLAGVGLLTVRMVLDARYVRWLKRTADPRVPATLTAAMRRFCEQLQLSPTRIGLGITSHVSTALVVGWLRPMVLLPAAVIGQMPRQQLELVLAHELAHIRRYDPLVNMFQVVVETVLFYHPVVRMVSQRIRVERENCTDDLVVQISNDSMSYARALTALEELRGESIRLSIGATDGDFTKRIRRLFKSPPRRQKGILSTGIISVITALLVVFANAAAWQFQQWRGGDDERVSVEIVLPAEPALLDNLSHLEPAATPVTDVLVPLEQLPEVDGAAVDLEDAVATAPATTNADTGAAAQQLTMQTSAPVPESAGTGSAREVPVQASPVGDAMPAATVEVTADEPPLPAVGEALMADTLEAAPALDLETLSQIAYVPAPQRDPEPRPVLELSGGQLLHMEPPEYPRRAMRRGVETEVRLSFVIDAAGRPQDIDIVSANGDISEFTRAARRAVEQWRFEPYRLGEEVVERRVEQVVEFVLPEAYWECAPTTGSRINSRRAKDC